MALRRSHHTLALHADISWAARARALPPLGSGLADQDGRRVTVASLHGQTVLLTFLDSLCTKACPVVGRQLADVQQAVHPRGPLTLVVVSVDPADTPASVRHFLAESGIPAAMRVRWLMGSHSALAPVWAANGITVQPTKGDIAHSTVLYLADRDGYLRAGYAMPVIPSQVAADVDTVSRAAA